MTGDTRIGDAEREGAAAALADHYAAGRLDHSEYAERLDAIWTARTRGDLDVLFHDLPRLAAPAPPAPAPRRRGGGLPLPVIALAILLLGAFAITHLPFLLLAVAIVLIVRTSHHRRCARGRDWQQRSFPARW